MSVKIETIVLEDGFHYFCADPNRGIYSSHALREIAEQLDELNKPWEEEINKYFDEHPSNISETVED